MRKTQKKEMLQNTPVEAIKANMTTHYENESCYYESSSAIMVQEDVKQEEVSRGRKRYK
mgnify:CR=1 FL=1